MGISIRIFKAGRMPVLLERRINHYHCYSD